MKSRKGFADIVLIAGMAIVGIIIWLTGPSAIKAVGSAFNGGDKNQQKYERRIDNTRIVYVENPISHKLEPQKEIYKDYTNQAQAEQPPETLWEKFWHLGFIAVVIIAGITALIAYLGAWPLVNKWINALKAKIQVAEAKHDSLQTAAIDIAQAIDDGWDAYDAQVKVYTELLNAETDSTKKMYLLSTVTALQTARKAMKDKIYAELDNVSLAKLTQLQTAVPGSTTTSL